MQIYSKRFNITFLICIICIAGFIRLYKLGDIPHGLTWDEAAIGYNGYSVIKTGYDEWYTKYPLSFRSFGDYKPPVAEYLTGLITVWMGLSPLTVRLLFALCGVTTIVTFYFLVLKLLKETSVYKSAIVWAAVALTLSPWHIQFSRTAFESGLALFFLITGLLFFTFYTESKTEQTIRKITYLFVSMLLLVVSMYTYHSAKIVTPLLTFTFLVHHRKIILKDWKIVISIVVLGISAIYPLASDSLFSTGNTRASVLLFAEYGWGLETIRQIGIHYLEYFSLSFLIFGKVEKLRHGTGVYGVLSIITFILCCLGFISGLIYGIKEKKISSVFVLAVLWILIGLLPAALSQDSYHQNRSLLALPGFVLLSVCGFSSVLKFIEKIKWCDEQKLVAQRVVINLIFTIEIISFVSYWHYYQTTFAAQSATDYQDGYIEAFNLTSQYEKGTNGKPMVDKILFSSRYGQPYIYALFVKKTHPLWYQGGALIKYEFSPSVSIGDLQRTHVLVVATLEDNLPLEKAQQIIYGSDGLPRFAVYLSEDYEK